MKSGLGCAYCAKPTGRGKALCRKHWMMISHFHRQQIGAAMVEERDSGEGPDEEGRYHSEEYREAVAGAVASIRKE